MTRIVFVNRYYAPDHSATSQILTDLATFLAREGRDVHVVTGDETYAGQRALAAEDVLDGVNVHRVRSGGFGRSTIARRAADSIALYASMYRTARKVLRPGDILVAKTDPPLLSLPMARAAKLSGAHLVNWLQDLYPEVAEALGVRAAGGLPGAALLRLRDRSLRQAAMNVAIGDVMRTRLLARGLAPDRLSVVPNWSDDEAIHPVPPCENRLRAEWELEDRFVLGYSGNLGRAHEVETLLGAAERLRVRRDICFLFIGGGHHVESLRERASVSGLADAFLFKPYQDRKLLSQSLCVPDAHWLSLRPELEGLIVPSKFYGIAAAGRPVISVTAREGEIGRLIHRFDCGVVTKPGDPERLAAAISTLADDRRLCAEMGARARDMLDTHFTKAASLRSWRDLLDGIGVTPVPVRRA